ncbi:MAG TPA: alpha-2-macroglobulin, partial [Xanthomonadales bacterium]|nr:alpha-2-macroglobulin [Xanthomonadales bacterium]
ALLRDHDGRPVAPQPLYATLKQPDGRALHTQQLEPAELGYYAFERRIAPDARTGRWSLELSTDPSAKDGARAFAFRVEEFLPERLKLELASPRERLAPGELLPLEVEADYLYGAPAAGNRFTARVSVANDSHPVDALADFHFGDPTIELPKAPRDAVDAVLDEDGKLSQEIAPVEDVTIVAPTSVVVSGSVYESGGRAVTRTLERTIWPAAELVGIRPLFELKDGSSPNADARFEVVRTNAAGELLAAPALTLRVIREHRDFSWRYDASAGWRADYVQRYETTHEQPLAIAAGQRAQVSFPVEWGNYRVEIEDPETKLVAKLPFQAGWGWDDDNRGTDARPDKVKIALDRTHYRGGDTLKLTLTPPHAGPALLMLEGDGLLWHETRQVEAGTVVEVPLQADWERHDLYFTALVFRPGSATRKITPNRAIGVAHVPIAREERKLAVTLDAPDTMRPKQQLAIDVSAPTLAGRTARVRVTAVDLGVLNITRYPLPDAAAWFFAQRRLGIDAHDLYARVVEAFDGERARLRYGGDAALAALPGARRPDAGIETVDLFHEPVALDAQGKARVSIDVPDFNGTLRVRALVFGESDYGAAERDTIVRAPLVVEASTPRVLAPGDRARLTLDLQNLSGAERTFETTLVASGPIAIERTRASTTLADQAKQTLSIGISATGSYGVGEIRAQVRGPEVDVDRTFRFVVRPAWPATARAQATVLESAAPIAPDRALLEGLVPDSVVSRITVGTLPPFPFGSAVRGLIGYPYGCVEQTTSRAFPLVWMDDATAARFGLEPLAAERRTAMLADAFSRLSAMQAETGHFGMWPGDGWVATQMTPYVAELLLNARDAGFAIPDAVLSKALDRINEDLLAGGNGHYEYDHAEHLRLAEMAHGGYALARVAKAPVGTLRALYDNERTKLEAPLPLVHLGVALKLMGDEPRAVAAIEEAFTREFERPNYLGDYGTELRDLALMVALTHEHGLDKPAYDARVVELARDLLGRGGTDGTPWYLSTQEQVAIFRLGRALLDDRSRTFAATVSVGGSVEEHTGESLVAREFTPAQLTAGVQVVPRGEGPFYVTQDVAGVTRSAPVASDEAAPLRIRRSWHRTDGAAFDGESLREGEVLVAHLAIESAETMNDALVVDLLPGGLEIENLNLTDASQWQGVAIDGVDLAERESAAEIRYEEYRDDRYVAAIKLWAGSTAHLFYLVRAVSPGEFAMPPPSVEDMYRPTLRAFGVARPARLTVTPP